MPDTILAAGGSHASIAPRPPAPVRSRCAGPAPRRAGAGPRAPEDVHERRGADPAEGVSELSSPRIDCADVAPHVRGRAAVGPRDPRSRRAAPDAAVAR